MLKSARRNDLPPIIRRYRGDRRRHGSRKSLLHNDLWHLDHHTSLKSSTFRAVATIKMVARKSGGPPRPPIEVDRRIGRPPPLSSAIARRIAADTAFLSRSCDATPIPLSYAIMRRNAEGVNVAGRAAGRAADRHAGRAIDRHAAGD